MVSTLLLNKKSIVENFKLIWLQNFTEMYSYTLEDFLPFPEKVFKSWNGESLVLELKLGGLFCIFKIALSSRFELIQE